MRRKIEKEFDKKEEVTEQEAQKALFKTREFLQGHENKVPARLREVWNDILLLYQMLNDWSKGNYKAPWKTIAAISMGLLYLVNPLDIIPDFLFMVGWLDDVAILKKVIEYVKDDLEDYKTYLSENR